MPYNSAMQEPQPLPESFEPSFNLSAWIDPRGRFFPVDDCQHYTFAEEVLGPAEAELRDAVDALEGRGWLHLSFGQVYIRHQPTQSQIDTAFDIWCRAEDNRHRTKLETWVTNPRITRS